MAAVISLQREEAIHREFLCRLYCSTRVDEVASWGWSEEQVKMFLEMQFDLQARAYALQFPDARSFIVCSAGRPVGRLLTWESEDELRLVDIALLPEVRDRGIGTHLLREMQKEAAEQHRAVRLHVHKGNPATRLYERLGFLVTGETEFNLAMVWRAEA